MGGGAHTGRRSPQAPLWPGSFLGTEGQTERSDCD